MLKRWLNIFALAASLSLVACDNSVNFTGKSDHEAVAQVPLPPSPPVITDPVPEAPVPTAPVPTEPVPVPIEPQNPTPEPLPDLALKSGTCPESAAESVLSCLNCQSKPAEIPPPLLSRKAQELLEVMTAGCSVPNASDPAGYKPPTREQVLKRLIQCSPNLYPDTSFMGSQKFTVESLIRNATAQKSAFGGLYFNWASTDFETYFGLEISEARYTFCRGDISIKSGGIYPKEYYDALYNNQFYSLPPQWVKAQKIRQSLRNCMTESLRNPNPERPPGKPGEVCRYESAEGVISSKVVDKANQWIQAGHKVFYEGFNLCGELEAPENLTDKKGWIKMAVKVCE